MNFYQKTVSLRPRTRGFHLVTGDVVSALPDLRNIRMGMCHLQLQHTSASLLLNENADPTVRQDFEALMRELVPENFPYTHDYEGGDDMPAHIKSALFGTSLSLPVTDGALALGTWQGIYLGEHREHGGSRKIVVTLWGV